MPAAVEADPESPAEGAPRCARCGTTYRLVVDHDLVSARCASCRYVRVFAPMGSPWAALWARADR